LLAVLDGEVVGCGIYELGGPGSRSAEVAFTVADDMHNRGIGMLLHGPTPISRSRGDVCDIHLHGFGGLVGGFAAL
jgi:hypothetical protein